MSPSNKFYLKIKKKKFFKIFPKENNNNTRIILLIISKFPEGVEGRQISFNILNIRFINNYYINSIKLKGRGHGDKQAKGM